MSSTKEKSKKSLLPKEINFPISVAKLENHERFLFIIIIIVAVCAAAAVVVVVVVVFSINSNVNFFL